MPYAKLRYVQVKSTMDSCRIIRNGLVITTVSTWRTDFFSNSELAIMLRLPVSFRIFAAFLAISTGTYVSGIMKRNGKVAPANIRPSQKHHRQLTVAMKPDASGPNA